MDYNKPVLVMTNRTILNRISIALDSEAARLTRAGLDDSANEVRCLMNQVDVLINSNKEVGSIISYE